MAGDRIDAIKKPPRRARARATETGVSVEWLQGDVTRLSELGLTSDYTLFFDRGVVCGQRFGR
jgi:hypothetical protein